MAHQGMWVFGYGSLMWNPEFPYRERQIARLSGFHRSFCMSSIHHRGTTDHPGLVLALDPDKGAHCDGLAFFVEPDQAEKTLDELRERELISSAYLETIQTLTLRDTRCVEAVTYIIDGAHDQYCGGLALERQAQIIAHAVGQRGPNADYLHNTTDHLKELGLCDSDLTWLSERVRRIRG